MSQENEFETIVKKYLNDPEFAKQLKSDPLSTLAESGVDVTGLATRLNMNTDQLQEYLINIFQSQTFNDLGELADAMGDTSGGY